MGVLDGLRQLARRAGGVLEDRQLIGARGGLEAGGKSREARQEIVVGDDQARPPIDDRSAAFSALVTSSAGEQSSTRSFTPSGPKSVNSGTAIAPSFMVPKTAA